MPFGEYFPLRTIELLRRRFEQSDAIIALLP
jgi:hypothetical protein